MLHANISFPSFALFCPIIFSNTRKHRMLAKEQLSYAHKLAKKAFDPLMLIFSQIMKKLKRLIRGKFARS